MTPSSSMHLDFNSLLGSKLSSETIL